MVNGIKLLKQNRRRGNGGNPPNPSKEMAMAMMLMGPGPVIPQLNPKNSPGGLGMTRGGQRPPPGLFGLARSPASFAIPLRM